MAMYIDADKFIKWIEKQKRLSKGYTIFMLQETATADVEEVKHGYWKHSVEFGFATKYHYWNCSVCGVASEDEGKEKYCRECGAKMDGAENATTTDGGAEE